MYQHVITDIQVESRHFKIKKIGLYNRLKFLVKRKLYLAFNERYPKVINACAVLLHWSKHFRLSIFQYRNHFIHTYIHVPFICINMNVCVSCYFNRRDRKMYMYTLHTLFTNVPVNQRCKSEVIRISEFKMVWCIRFW